MMDRNDRLRTEDLLPAPESGWGEPRRSGDIDEAELRQRDYEDLREQGTRVDADARGREDTGGMEQADPDAQRETETADEQPSTRSEAQTLLPASESQTFTTRWQTIQAGFVDEPRQSVEQADALVAELMQHLAGIFSEERRSLESQWDRGDDVSTEELRVSLQRYRSFFDRLLTV